MSWSITTGISPQDSTRRSHVPCSPDIQIGNRCSPAGALWLRCPDFQGTQWSARATDFFSGTLGPSWFLQWTNHGNHEVNSHGAYGAYVLTPGLLDIGLFGFLEGRALPSPHPLSQEPPENSGKKKGGRSPRGVDPQEISRIPKVLAQHPMVYHYLPCWN